MNYSQMYAQLRAELREGVSYYFTHDDEIIIQKYNAEFQQLDNMEEAFNEFYRKPFRGEQGVKMPPTEMLTHIKSHYPAIELTKKNLQAMGRMLKRKDIPLYRMHDKRRYLVKKLTSQKIE